MMSKVCPHCGGHLLSDYNGDEQYYTCLMCGHSYNLEGNPIIGITPQQYAERYGIRLTTRKY